ncbi:hypothetical protein Ocin01_11286 [Orchesella cincta]|uniref:Uncharacterized protein n=1 Tax=Orchesella cincta TaxID=48709 RepID=A0A1D2MRF3_ORCCI|nr:hypothetical protein Ocin01_11286 [Orchesella cincta]
MNSELVLDPRETFTIVEDVVVAMTKSFPLELFLDDAEAVLTQVVNPGRKGVEYKRNVSSLHNDDEVEDQVVYRGGLRNVNSTVVVLHKNDDKLPVFNDNRVFVVLRQDPMQKKVVSYFGNYVYARLATNSHVICNKTFILERVCFEWDAWDRNRALEKAPYKYLGWADCSRTFFSSCQPRPLKNNRKAGGNDAMYPKVLKSNYSSVAENLSFVTPTSFLTVIRGENDSTYDLLWDLDNDKAEAYHVRELIKNFSVITDPSTTLRHNKKDGKLKGFNCETTHDASLLTLMQLAKDNFQTKHEGKNVTHTESTYEMLKGNLHKHAILVKKIHETRVQLRVLLYHIGRKDYLTMRKNPKDMEMMKLTNPDFKNLEERLEGLEKELELIDQQDSDMDQKLQNLDDSVSMNMSLSDILSKPGWKYQEFAADNNNNQNVLDKLAWKDGLLFYGFGTCAYEKAEWNIHLSDYDEPTNEDLEKMADFYLKLLRLHCLPEAKYYLLYLIDTGFIKRNANFFEIPEDLSVLQKPKSGINELRMISAALEFSIFTKTYQMLLQMEGIPTRRRTTDIPLIYIPNASRTLDFLLHFTALFVKRARADVDIHFIKMARNLVITLRGIMTRLMQDYEILQIHCKNGWTQLICEKEFKSNYGNRLAVNVALQWVLHGLAPIEMNRNVNTEKNLKAFYKANKKSIELSLAYYELE